jgi:hypothetical protein
MHLNRIFLWVNVLVLLGYLISLGGMMFFPDVFFFNISQVLFGFLLLQLFGVNIVIAYCHIFRRRYEIVEQIFFGVLLGIVLFPALIFGLIVFLDWYTPIFFGGIYVISLFSLILTIFLRRGGSTFVDFRSLFSREKFISVEFLGLVIFCLVILIHTFLYRHLPDLDPYGWIVKITDIFSDPSPVFKGGREFFVVFSQVHRDILGIDLFSLFKYVYPFYSLIAYISLVFIGQNIKNRKLRLVFLLSFLMCPITILSLVTSMPQYIWILFVFAFVATCINFSERKWREPFLLLGLLFSLLFYFHVASFIFLFVWGLVAFWLYREWFWRNKLTSFLFLALALSHFEILERSLAFFWKFTSRVFQNIFSMNPNWNFPVEYTNIDGASMGWPGFFGVLQYYGFYMGPVIALILVSFLFFLLFRPDFRLYIFQKMGSLGFLCLLFLFGIFFSIAEIFPRLLSLAMLPDRAWVVLGILFIIFLYFILGYFDSQKNQQIHLDKKIFIGLFVLSLVISFSGATFINWKKSFLITQEQLISAEWIHDTISEESIFFSKGLRNVLTGHAYVKYEDISYDAYFDSDALQEEINRNLKTLSKECPSATDYDYVGDVYKILSHENENEEQIAKDVSIYTKQFLQREEEKCEEIVLEKDFYIYYAPPSKENPYIQRSYVSEGGSSWGFFAQEGFIMDQLPDTFVRVYDREGVIIWKMLYE